jgi:hypothetical protein
MLKSVCAWPGSIAERSVELRQRLVGPADVVERGPEVGAHVDVVRIEREGLLVVRDGLAEPVRVVETIGELDRRFRVLRIALDDVLEGLQLFLADEVCLGAGRMDVVRSSAANVAGALGVAWTWPAPMM